MHPVKLIGLDFGTTTSSAVIAAARLTRNSVTGRTELSDVQECYRSAMVFTPLQNDRLDEAAIERLVAGWLAAGDVHPEEVFGGGALLTGLTAQQRNAGALVAVIRRRLGDTLVATADDPCLESWLAFLGSCAALSRAHPETFFLNLDVGGGTTNLALGRAGEVLRTGCLFVGARHIEVIPGSYQIVQLSCFARALFGRLGIGKGPGDTLSERERDAVLDWYLNLLEAAATGERAAFEHPVPRLHEQVPFRPPSSPGRTVVTVSGGVGELVYAHLDGRPWPPTTYFGDLGIDLAQRLVAAPRWSADLRTYRPASAGRATVHGLLRHNTEISGSTLFLPRPEVLPLNDLPVLGTLSAALAEEDLDDLLGRVQRSPRGGCLTVTLAADSADSVRALGRRLAAALRRVSFPADRPLVLLVRENLGKVLGHYATEWGGVPVNVVVIDEVPARDARFARVGRPRQQVVPVSFYGLNEPGEKP